MTFKFSRLSKLIPLICVLQTNQCLAQNTSYSANTNNIGGSLCTAFGSGALRLNTGKQNVAMGYQAMYNATTTNSMFNIAVGYQALYNTTDQSDNVAIGNRALYNTGIGSGTYEAVGNTGVGSLSLFYNRRGAFNTCIGGLALYGNTTGNYNTAVGAFSLYSDSTGEHNTAVGESALGESKSGSFNVAVGDSAGYNSTGSGNLFLGVRSGANETGDNKLYLSNDSNRTILYGDLSTGQLLIGNNSPAGYTFKGNRKLNVLGGILADSVRVALSSNWADYVFADDYQLKPLNELSNYIKENKHLPNIPTANEVASNGIELGDINIKLLEKIEELTLYILQQQKEMDNLKGRLNKIERQQEY